MCTAVPTARLQLIRAFYWTIRYEVYGYPPPNITWFKDGSPLVENDVIYDRVTSRDDAVIKGRLVFKMSNHWNNGNYTLVATNVHGSTNETVSAIFLQPPGIHPYTLCSEKIPTFVFFAQLLEKLTNLNTNF